jgi:hypothetical protein
MKNAIVTRKLCAADVGIPTSIQSATLAAFMHVVTTVRIHAKSHGAVINAVRLAKVAADKDDAYKLESSGTSRLSNSPAVAADLVKLLTFTYNEHLAAVEKLAAKKSFTNPKDLSNFRRVNTRSMCNACDNAKDEILTLIGGREQHRINYKGGEYRIEAAPAASPAGKGGKGATSPAGKGKKDAPAPAPAPAKGKGKKDAPVPPQKLIAAAIDENPGVILPLLRDGFLSRALKVAFGEKSNEFRDAIIAAAMEIEAAVTALQPRKSK